MNTNKLPVANKIVKGQEIVDKSTNNPDVPGNATVLAAFAAAQEALLAANNDLTATRGLVAQKLGVRDTAVQVWNDALSALAAFTQSATGGDADKIMTTGFSVIAPPAPPPPAGAPVNLMAGTNGSPGKTKLSWKRVNRSVSYIVQMSPDPITDTSWATVATPTKASCETDGADPGKKYWFQVAAVSATGQGPWSAPACRQVM